jgi:ATP-binding cassette subfamily B protein
MHIRLLDEVETMNRIGNLRSRIAAELGVLKWAFGRAWEIDRKNLMFWMAISIAGALLPVLFLSATRRIVDIITVQAEQAGGFGQIAAWIGALVGFLFLSAIYNMLPSIFDFTLYTRFAVGMQKKLGDLMRKVPLRLFDDPELALKIDMTMPTIKRLSYFLGHFFKLLGETVALAGILALAVSTSRLLLLFAVALLAVSLTMGFISAIENHRRWVNEGQNARLSEYYYSQVFDSGLAMEYRMLNLDPFIRRRWYDIIRPMWERTLSTMNRSTVRGNVAAMLGTAFKFLLLLAGLYLVAAGAITVGTLVMFVAMFDQISSKSGNFGNLFMNAYRYVKDFELQKQFFEMDFREHSPAVPAEAMRHETPGDQDDRPVVFELRGVSYRYNSEKYALKDVSMKIRRGEIVALVGGNGAGKSTLVKILLGFYKPTEGQVFFEGKSYEEIDLSKLVERIGVTFQDYAKFEFTLRENIAFGDLTRLRDDPALIEAARKGGAAHIVERQTGGLDTHLGRWYHKQAIQLSGGEWQRIAVSRAHISDRDILIMDEPAAMLDPIAEMEQFSNLRSSISHRTGILISHRIGFARLADRVAVLDEGRLVEFGTHEELMDRRGMYYKLFSSQAEWYRKGEAV